MISAPDAPIIWHPLLGLQGRFWALIGLLGELSDFQLQFLRVDETGGAEASEAFLQLVQKLQIEESLIRELLAAVFAQDAVRQLEFLH